MTLAARLAPTMGAVAFALGLTGAPVAQAAFGPEDCGVPRGATGCTANDTGIVSFALDPAFSGTDPTTCTVGNNVSFHLLVSVQTTANVRYDLGVLLSKDGKDPTVAAPTGAGACYVYAMPTTSPFVGATPAGDGDACGDLQASAGAAQFNAGLVTMPCIAGPGGLLQIQGVAMWDQNANTTCNGPTDLQAGTGSKCKLTTSTVPITVVTPTGTVQLVKDIVPNGDTGLFNLSVASGASPASTATDVTDGGSVTRSSITGGTVVTLTETAGTGTNLVNYTSVLSCVRSDPQAALTISNGNQITMPTPAVGVVCTYTNTRKQGSIQLRKSWVNAKIGDTASLTATGIVNSATAALASTADLATETDIGLSATMFAGETATLAETLSAPANYTSALVCTNGPTGPPVTVTNNQVTMPSTPISIVCTWTNTRVNRSLTLVKQWTNGKTGDQIAVTTTGLANNATVSSTSSGSNQTTGSAVSNVPGGTVTLPAETFNVGSQANYTTTVACTGATPSGSTPGSTFTMPDNDVTCTYTNARVNRSLTLV
ncbi:MAG: hypothetical protein IT520_02290, partial [Burkholderiales bacterium]|nr:hypothetical protein [Burkholderiales bacterium]